MGAISVSLDTVESFTEKSTFWYDANHDECEKWLRLERVTCPSYAHGANGGVVVAGTYELVNLDAFEATLAPLQLSRSHDSQVDWGFYSGALAIIAGIAGLMSLDSYLSICGHISDITNGPSRLLQGFPTLIQRVMVDFDLEFSNVDRVSRARGSRTIKTISSNLLQFLIEQNLGNVEQLFTLVGLLRTTKMALRVARGPDTTKLHDVLI
ncbi:MAG: hypothetical protein Q9208_003322 [Pyrenodesmia sp. 3 TL-2023]